MPLSANDILVYDGAQWVNQPSIDSPTFYVDSTNHRVGIGTTTPSYKLEVVRGGAGVDDGVRVLIGSVANLRLARSQTPTQSWIVRTDSDQKFKVIDETATGSPTRVTIDTSGRVGIGTTSPASKLEAAGAIATAVVSKNANYTATIDDSVLLADASPGALTITLPSVIGIVGRQYTIKKIDGSANAVTVSAAINQNIDYAGTKTLSAQNQSITIVASDDGTNRTWRVVASV